MKSSNQQHFSRAPQANVQRSSFNRSHSYKTTFNSGLLIPIFVDEALPGDTFSLNMTAFGRMATPIKPVMDNMHLESFFFAVPNRLVWDNWAKFNGEQDNPDDSTDFVIPQIVQGSNTINAGTISDYMGIPTKVENMVFNSLHHRAYNLIWNQFFRDENLQDSVVVDKDDGPQDLTNYNLPLRRGKRHDYFTSCLPWPQKGPVVTLPFGDTAPVVPSDTPIPTFDVGNVTSALYSRTANDHVDWDPVTLAAGAATWNNTGLQTNLQEATSITINVMREAFQVQKLYERDARGGTRLTEIIQSHFGVISPDARLQRPEYLGGGSTQINMTVVPQTTQDIDGPGVNTPQGNLAAYGTFSASHGFTKSFTEHCVIIGMVSIRADISYQQGLNRMWSRQTRFDFFWPALAHLGEMEVLNQEIYTQGTSEDQDVFGYQERYAEYRYKPSQITGDFRSNHDQSLDLWHLAQNFGNLPVLNDEFIEDNPPIDRVIAVPSEPQFIFDSYMRLTCARPMPTYSVPGLIDHF